MMGSWINVVMTRVVMVVYSGHSLRVELTGFIN